jgi:Ca2+-binding EF-hand superfamily protein
LAQAQLLRVARLSRLYRLMRLVKKINGFNELFLMTTAVQGSIMVLGWSLLLLFLVQMLLALLVFFLLQHSFFNVPEYSLSAKQEVYAYFGSFTRAMLTMFELTLADWPNATRLLTEEANEYWMYFCLAHKLTIGFAVIGVINGVFMQETFKAASMDDALMVRQKLKAMKEHKTKMMRLFSQADESGDGSVDREEFKAVMENPNIQLWLSAMDMDVGDVDSLFTLLDDSHDGILGAEELVDGIGKLKGPARSLDVHILIRKLSDFEHRLNHLCSSDMSSSGQLMGRVGSRTSRAGSGEMVGRNSTMTTQQRGSRRGSSTMSPLALPAKVRIASPLGTPQSSRLGFSSQSSSSQI